MFGVRGSKFEEEIEIGSFLEPRTPNRPKSFYTSLQWGAIRTYTPCG
jgi:hypothetical protein